MTIVGQDTASAFARRLSPCPDPIDVWIAAAVRGRSTARECRTELARYLAGHLARTMRAGTGGVKDQRCQPAMVIAIALLEVERRA
jgi:hypothetical protein